VGGTRLITTRGALQSRDAQGAVGALPGLSLRGECVGPSMERMSGIGTSGTYGAGWFLSV